MPKHPEIAIKITQPEAEVFINDIAQMGLVPAVQAWFNVEIEAQK